MSNKSSKGAKSSKKKVYIYTIIIIVFIAIAVSRFFVSITLTTVRHTTLELATKCKGIIIKDENIVESPLNGYVRYDCLDGYKVPKNYLVATVFKNKDSDKVKSKLDKVNNKINSNIDDNNSQNSLFKSDLNSINSKINNELLKLQQYVSNNSIDDIYNSKDTINNLTEKRAAIAKNFGYNSYDVDTTSLDKEKTYLQQMLNSYEYKINSSNSGIISTKFDGYENKFSLSNYKKSDADSIENDITNYEDNSDKKIYNVKTGQPIFKIINNFSWNIVCVLDKKDMSSLTKGAYITVAINNDKQLETSALIADIKKSDGKYIVNLQLGSMLEYVYNKRILDLTIIKGRYTGFEIPKSSLTHKYLIQWECPNKYKFVSPAGLKKNKLYFSNLGNPLSGQVINKIIDIDTTTYVFLIDKCNYKLSGNNKLLKIENSNGDYSLTKKHKSKIINSIGVYISKIGIVRYCPVNLLKIYNNIAIIDNLEASNSKVKYYDKVVRQPDKVRNDELIN